MTTPRLTQADIGKVVCIRFWDHAEGTGDPVLTEAIGRLIDLNALRAHVRPWTSIGLAGDNPKNNIDLAILRSTIIDVATWRGIR